MPNPYNPNKLMSLGHDCHVATLLEGLHIRQPGPLDWVYQTKGILALPVAALNGSLYETFLNKAFTPYTYIDEENPGRTIRTVRIMGGDWIHEDVYDQSTYLKLLDRFTYLRDHIKYGGKFIYQLTDDDVDYSVDLFDQFLKSMNIDYDRVIFLDQTNLFNYGEDDEIKAQMANLKQELRKYGYTYGL